MSTPILRLVRAEDLSSWRREPIDSHTLRDAADIVENVRIGHVAALRALAERFDSLAPGDSLMIGPDDLRAALEGLPSPQRETLERTADRVRRFAQAQRDCLQALDLSIPGGRAGHTIEPIERVGCYAPGGRFPLPSSALMTVIPARVAGAQQVWLASPRPARATLAAASIAGADGVLCAGGAQAIAALAYGVGGVGACDIVVGPGNRWVTAAKHVVSRHVAIDMLAGPSELVVLADESADPRVIATDLLAQAEHDPDARPILITTSSAMIPAVERELERQLESLPTAHVARDSLQNCGLCAIAKDRDQAVAACDALAPEHLQIMMRRPEEIARRVRHAGAVFIGSATAEALGDYGAGPNHTLPTGGQARSHAGLSVLTFLRARTWLQIDDPSAAAALFDDAVMLGRMEGLEGHSRSAEARTGVASGAA